MQLSLTEVIDFHAMIFLLSLSQEQLDPFSLVADELSLVANKLRAMVIAEVCILEPAICLWLDFIRRLLSNSSLYRCQSLLQLLSISLEWGWKERGFDLRYDLSLAI